MIPLLAALAPFVNPVSLVSLAESLPAKAQKDELRMRLFGAAVVNKTSELTAKALANAVDPAKLLDAGLTALSGGVPQAAGFQAILYVGALIKAEATHVEEFGRDLADVLGEYEHDAESAGNLKKWSLATLMGHSDPFKSGRERVREFARKWDLDPAFVEAMG